uniref:G-protein coupled receptors family 1 profile domain-containing protein n=1 Tax=Naja naja TaxID=35670 RepID=A0A8C6Y712_NAJNA
MTFTSFQDSLPNGKRLPLGIERTLHLLSIAVYGVACLLGVTGNGLVIWIASFKMEKTVNVVWFLNLALADFVFTFFLPLSIAYTALGFHWPFGRFLCKLNSSLAFLNMFASVFLLTVISLDRCLLVVLPVWSRNHRKPRLAWAIALATWGAALLISSPYFLFRDTALSARNATSCYNNFDREGGAPPKLPIPLAKKAWQPSGWVSMAFGEGSLRGCNGQPSPRGGVFGEDPHPTL